MGSLISILVMSSSIQFTALTTLSTVYVLLTPFTKVEESMNMQAVHDFIFIGFPRTYAVLHTQWNTVLVSNHYNSSVIGVISKSLQLDAWPLPDPVDVSHARWDHEDFTGPVARTFIGSFILSLMTLPWTLFTHVAGDKLYLQIIARINLAVLVIGGFNSFANAIGKKYGSVTRRALVVLTLTQFHFVFYASRTLPNTFALALCLLAFSKWILKDFRSFIPLVAATVIVFRFETCLIFGWILMYEIFVSKELRIWSVLKIGIPSGIVCLIVTVLFDSMMWGQWVWPEGDSLYLNVYENKSHEWGTSPFLWYFYSAIPRSMLFSVFLVPFATKRCLKSFLTVPLLFILTYSFLPHKELRFILYVIPLLNVCAANTMAIMVEKLEGTKPSHESYIGNMILKLMGREVNWGEEAEAADEERERKQQQEEESKRRARVVDAKPPAQYDAIVPSHPIHRQRRNGKHGMEAQLDESYSRITAAVLEKHSGPVDADVSQSDDLEEEQAPLSCTFFLLFVLMGIHILCNVGFTIYASYAAWNNYPGGEGITHINNHIRTADLSRNVGHKSKTRTDIGVYVCNLAAQTGVTRFTQLDYVVYDKSPSLDHIANRTIFMKKGRGFNKHVTHDFSHMKIVYLMLEKVDVPFLHQYCSSATVLNSKKPAAVNTNSAIENVVCTFGENAKNCKILKIVNQYNGIEYVQTKNVVFKTAPVLWLFRCQNVVPNTRSS